MVSETVEGDGVDAIAMVDERVRLRSSKNDLGPSEDQSLGSPELKLFKSRIDILSDFHFYDELADQCLLPTDPIVGHSDHLSIKAELIPLNLSLNAGVPLLELNIFGPVLSLNGLRLMVTH